MTITVQAKDRIAGVFVALAICAGLLLLAASQAGCGFPAALAKAHKGVKEMSQAIEPPLAAECLRRAEVCAKAGKAKDACPPLTECRSWKASYVLGAQYTHRGLALSNRVYDDLKKAKVLK